MFVVGGENKRLCKREESKMWEAFLFKKVYQLYFLVFFIDSKYNLLFQKITFMSKELETICQISCILI